MHPLRVRRPPAHLAATVLAGFALVACAGEADPEPSPEPVHAIDEPWQAAPFRIGETILGLAVTTCRADGALPALPLAVADARGGGQVTLLFADPSSEYECTVAGRPDGSLEFKGGGGGPSGLNQLPDPGVAQVSGTSTIGTIGGPGGGGANTGASSAVSGRVGAAVAAVDVILPDGRRIRASTANGWFSAWWPSDQTTIQVQAIGADGLPLGPSHP